MISHGSTSPPSDFPSGAKPTTGPTGPSMALEAAAEPALLSEVNPNVGSGVAVIPPELDSVEESFMGRNGSESGAGNDGMSARLPDVGSKIKNIDGKPLQKAPKKVTFVLPDTSNMYKKIYAKNYGEARSGRVAGAGRN